MIDIILVTHNNIGRAITTVEAVQRYTNPNDYHLTIVDDGNDLTGNYFDDNIGYLKVSKPFKEYNEALNYGFEQTLNPYVVSLANTIDVEPNWLQPLVNLLDKVPDCAVAQPAHLFPVANTIENAGMMFREPMMHHQNLAVGEAFHRHVYIREVDGAGFCCAMLRREAVYPLETGYYIGFQGFDDMDACLQLKEKAWKTYYCGYSAVYHHAFESRPMPWSEETLKKYDENRFRFLTRWAKWGEFSLEQE